MKNHEENGGGGGRGRVVVITGASAGVGRATVRAFARAGRSIGLLARGRDGLEAARREVEALGGQALVSADRRRRPRRRSRPPPRPSSGPSGRSTSGSTTRWLSVFSPVKQMKPEEYRRVTEVTYLGTVYGTLAALRRMLPRDRGIDRPGRLGAGVSRHPAPVGLLRRQARDPGLLRLAPLRADPRREPRPAHDGADAGAEHAAVRLGQEPPAAQGAAGAADLPARGRRRGDRLGGRPRPPRDRRRLADRRGDRRQQDRAGLARPLPRPHRLRRAR